MNATFDQKYDQNFLNTAKAFYINASTAYTPILSIVCAISAIPGIIAKGANTQQLVPLICVLLCGIITFILQRTRADQLFKNVDEANDNVTCTVKMDENHLDYTLHTPINDLRQYHFDFNEIKELIIGKSKGIIVLDDITILPFGISIPEDKNAAKETSQFLKQVKKKAPQNTMTLLYKTFIRINNSIMTTKKILPPDKLMGGFFLTSFATRTQEKKGIETKRVVISLLVCIITHKLQFRNT